MLPTRSKAWLRTRVRQCTQGHRAAGFSFAHRQGDRKYSLLSSPILQYEVSRANVARRRYIAERYDCEDFAAALWAQVVYQCSQRSDMEYAPAFGFMWYQGHAASCVVLDNNGFYRLEPQKLWALEQLDNTVKRISLIVM